MAQSSDAGPAVERARTQAARTTTLVRGAYVFTIEHGRAGRDGAAADGGFIVVTRRGIRVASGALSLFSPGYMASLRYQLDFFRAMPKPVGRIGELLIGPDAATLLCAILESAEGRPAR